MKSPVNIIVKKPNLPDPIEESLLLRLCEPENSYKSIVPSKNYDEKEEHIFNLRIKGKGPKFKKRSKSQPGATSTLFQRRQASMWRN